VNVDLVIFDCDGVLVDSEVISCRAHAETLTRHGYPITAEQVLERFLGRSMRQATLEVEAELGRSLPDDFASQTYAEIFPVGLRLRWKPRLTLAKPWRRLRSPSASRRADRRRKSAPVSIARFCTTGPERPPSTICGGCPI
jgi:beta-phosphoglucomutase-like phosphatase (HAD superfamily)